MMWPSASSRDASTSSCAIASLCRRHLRPRPGVAPGRAPDDPGHLVVQALRERVAAHVEDPDKEGDRTRAAEPLEERLEVGEVEEHLGHRELRPSLELLVEALSS